MLATIVNIPNIQIIKLKPNNIQINKLKFIQIIEKEDWDKDRGLQSNPKTQTQYLDIDLIAAFSNNSVL
jgi:hypothetical protein